MKKIILCVMMLFCVMVSFGQTSGLQEVINKYFETTLKNDLPFLETFPFIITESDCYKIESKEFSSRSYGGSTGRCNYFSLIEDCSADATFVQGFASCTPYKIEYTFDSDGLHKVVYYIRTTTNFYWLDKTLNNLFEIIKREAPYTLYTSGFFDYRVKVSDVEDKGDGYFYTSIEVDNLKNLYINWH